jgi:hypothetical protein
MDTPMESRTSYSLAVVAAGTALVVLFAGVGVILALGHDVPDAMWAAASGLSGALVGILIPTPGTAPAPDTVAAAAGVTKRTAIAAAKREADRLSNADDASAATKAGAAAALATVTNADVTAKVADRRNDGVPVPMMIDEIAGMFSGHAQVADARSQDADATLAADPAQTTTLQDGADRAAAAQAVHSAASAAAQIAATRAAAGGSAAAAAAAVLTAATGAADTVASGTDPAHVLTAAGQRRAAVAAAAIGNLVSGEVAAKVKQLTGAGAPVAQVLDELTTIFAAHEDAAKTASDVAQQQLTDHQARRATLQSNADQATAAAAVHQAAADAAQGAKDAATQVASPGGSAPAPTATRLGPQAIMLVSVAGGLFVVALALAVAIAAGAFHASNCSVLLSASPGKTAPSCDASLQSVGTAMLTLASSAGGVLLGLFATPDGKPAAAATTAKATT